MRWVVLLLALACARRPVAPDFTRYPDAEVLSVRDAHAYRGAPLCQRCHARDGGLRAGDPVALCGECHAPHRGNHPVRVAQAPPPRDLPLWRGQIACHTCHDPHDVKRNRSGLRLASSELCGRCHAHQHGGAPLAAEGAR